MDFFLIICRYLGYYEPQWYSQYVSHFLESFSKTLSLLSVHISLLVAYSNN